MKNYLKLVNFEWNRFAKLFGGLLLIIFIAQLGMTIFFSIIFIRSAPKHSAQAIANLESYDKFSLLNIVDSFWFLCTMIVGLVSLVFYLFFIWYRDWFARTSFVYRLLTLPTSRMNVFFAKLTTVMLSVFGLLAIQLIFLKVYEVVAKLIVPLSYRNDVSLFDLVRSSLYLEFFYPGDVYQFLMKYGLGLVSVILLFTLILIERSFRWIGIAYATLYFILSVIIALLPLILDYVTGEWFFVQELVWMEIGLLSILTVVSLFFSQYLLNRKVSV